MWRRVRIEQAADIISGGTPSRLAPRFWGDGIAWATPTDITACRRPLISETADSITREGLLNSSAKQLPAGSILLTSRATIGEARIAAMPISTNQGFKSLVAKPGYDGTFLYYQVLALRGQFERYGVGSTFPEINKRDVARVEFDCPEDEEEQRRIGRILWSVDTQITHTEALIAKQEQVRAGLMQDLFTRGVDETGRLRPPREEAPELYHETALGWLPKGWNVSTLGSLVDPNRPIVYGILMPGEHRPDGVPVVKVRDIQKGIIEANGLLRTSKAIDIEYARSRLNVNDILLSIRGTVGRLAIVPDELQGANITQDTARISIRKGSTAYFRYFLESAQATRFFQINTLGNAVQGINLRDVRRLSVPVPTGSEQVAIAKSLEAVVSCGKLFQDQHAKLRRLRTALLRDLLTPPAAAATEPRIAAE